MIEIELQDDHFFNTKSSKIRKALDMPYSGVISPRRVFITDNDKSGVYKIRIGEKSSYDIVLRGDIEIIDKHKDNILDMPLSKAIARYGKLAVLKQIFTKQRG